MQQRNTIKHATVSLPPSLLNDLLHLSLAEKLLAAQVLLQKIAEEESIIPKAEPSAPHIPAFNWEGGLSELNMSSVALQKKALEWR